MQYPTQAVCDIVLHLAGHLGVTEHLIDDLHHAERGFVMALILQRLPAREQVGLFQLADRPLADDWKDVRLKSIHDSVPMLPGKRAHADAVPFSGDILEGFTLFGAAFFLLLFLLFGRIDALVEQNLGFFFSGNERPSASWW